MLSQVNRRLSALADKYKTNMDLVREIVSGIVNVGSPQRGAGIQTLGIHIPDPMRKELLREGERWGLRTYRDVCYVALQVGLELLKATPTGQTVSEPPRVVPAPRPVPVAEPCARCGELKKPGALVCFECGDGMMGTC